jgi:hypothetical protein
MAIWSLLLQFGVFCGHLVYGFWYIFPVLVCCTKINLATLIATKKNRQKFFENFFFFSSLAFIAS